MKKTETSGPGSRPMYWENLSDIDKLGYENLQKDIANTIAISGRYKFTKTFQNIVDLIRAYIVRNNSTDKIRSLVCGIVWMSDSLALNTRQLTTLIGKCKSSVNAGFQSMGYVTVPMEANSAKELAAIFPFMRTSICLMRQWTLRKLSSKPVLPVKQAKQVIAQPSAEIETLIPDLHCNFDPSPVEFTDFVDEDDWIPEEDLFYTALF